MILIHKMLPAQNQQGLQKKITLFPQPIKTPRVDTINGLGTAWVCL